MKMHILSGGRLRLRKSIYLPDAAKGETMELPVLSFLLRHSQGNVLFDTGCHPSVFESPEKAEARWGSMAKSIVPIPAPGENVVDQLRLAGLGAADIDMVVNSHFHMDHCGCNQLFKKATIVCHERELVAVKQPDAEQKGYLRAEWDHPMPIETFSGERDLFNDGRIVLVPAPGHTPGMTAALVSLDRSGAFLLASDAVPLRAVLDRELSPRNNWDADRFTRSMTVLRRIEAGGAKLICGHDAGQWANLKKGADAYN